MEAEQLAKAIRAERLEVLRVQLGEAQKLKETERAALALIEIKKQKLFREDGFKSFSSWCEVHSPYSVKYSYRLSSRKVEFPEPDPPATATEVDIIENELPKALEAAEVTMERIDAVAKLMDETAAPTQVVDLETGTITDTESGQKIAFLDEIAEVPVTATQIADDLTGKILSHAGIDAAVRDELPPPPPAEPVNDAMGNLIPAHLAAGYQSAHVLFEKTYDHLYGIRDTLKAMLLEGNAVSQVTGQRVDNIFSSLAGIEKIVDKCRPFTVCFYCSGSPRQCRACGDSGFLTEAQYLDSISKR
jgi:hypothetical protein